MRRYFLSLACIALACQRGPDLAGSWAVCISDSLARSVCGTIEVGPRQKTPFSYRSYQSVSYQLDLAPILGKERTPRPRCGSLLVATDGSITALLGIECGVVLSYDGGNLIAEHLTVAGDSIFGRWMQSCFNTCRARGVLTLKRRPSGAA